MDRRSPTLAAVDLGASSGRVLTGRLVEGRLVTHEVGRFANTPVTTTAWSVGGARERLSWDVLSLWQGVREGLAVAARDHGPVAGIGVDTWAVDYGLLDGDGELLGNPVHYRDARTQGAPERLFEALPAAALYERTGIQVQPFNTLFQLVAEAGSARVRAAEDLLLVPDLLGFWLTGRRVAELTNASTTAMVDAATLTWSGAALDALKAVTGEDLSRLLPEVVLPGTVVGSVLDPVAAGLGLSGAQVVAVGSHDTASAVAAVPLTSERSAYISSGTWSLVGLERPEPVLSEAGRAANFTNERGVEGTVRFLRNVAGLWLLQESLRTWRAQGRPQELTDLLAAAAEVPPLRAVVDVDDPAFAPPGDMPARVVAAARRTGGGLGPVPESPAEVTRCILDSLALAYRRAVRTAGELAGVDVDVVHVVGGGSRNALLCRLTADATGLPVVAGPVEGTAMGNLLVQAVALGHLEGGLPAVREVVRASGDLVRYEPTAAGAAAWERAERRLADV
ncbi:rhamnulokinase [Cellulomonas marina]|uniref:Rhamnulokinase n=1 Tax=Cellulomonas marina TaxID=988821 RepID=A0A1I1AHF1_9CELL|nr:rhamnulokinase family protein [Cellulomonas marina]GIG29722.1 carbohydrate kinase [Cellulomonas marina]SFB35928.1 rhamnulokinase [Cellulomonas marina]